MTNEKVVVTKEVAEAIEYLRGRLDYKFADFMRVSSQGGWSTVKSSPLNNIEIETLAGAILNGYEIEKSPEEKVREYYDNLIAEDDGTTHGTALRVTRTRVIIGTLDILGIKIEGVNA